MKIYLTAFFALCLTVLSAQNFWTDVAESQMALPENAEWEALPVEYRTLSLDLPSLKNYMAKAPMEFTNGAKNNLLEVSLPLPDGSFEVFEVMESPSMHPDLTAQYPEIRSFVGIGKNDKTLRARFDHSYIGFHGTISGKEDVVYIQPYAMNQEEYHMAYFRKNFIPDNMPERNCGITEDLSQIVAENHDILHQGEESTDRGAGENVEMQVYRLAMSCTGEYAVNHGGTVQSVLSGFNVAVNRLNELLGRDANIRLELIPFTTSFIYLNPVSDPYPSGILGDQLMKECHDLFGTELGPENYDIGHLFQQGVCEIETGDPPPNNITTIAGVARFGAVCNGFNKGEGLTCFFTNNVLFMAENTWAHEVGHSFAARHTWANCPGAEFAFSDNGGYEPGSGSTFWFTIPCALP